MRTLFAAAMNEATIQSNEPMRVSAPEKFWCVLAFVSVNNGKVINMFEMWVMSIVTTMQDASTILFGGT